MNALMRIVPVGILILSSLANANTCYDGQFEVQAPKGKAIMSFQITTDASNHTLFNSTVVNPDDAISGYVDGQLKDFKVSDIIRADNNLKLTPVEGVKCPCTVLHTEGDELTINIEQLSDRSLLPQMHYFTLGRVNVTEFSVCKK